MQGFLGLSVRPLERALQPVPRDGFKIPIPSLPNVAGSCERYHLPGLDLRYVAINRMRCRDITEAQKAGDGCLIEVKRQTCGQKTFELGGEIERIIGA